MVFGARLIVIRAGSGLAGDYGRTSISGLNFFANPLSVWGLRGSGEVDRARGVAAVSGGNHAMAVAWAANVARVSAKIATPKAADPLRLKACRDMGADVVLCEDIRHAFDTMNDWAAHENRTMMHPFEGAHVFLGAAICGAEFVE